jgi:hypothetical protein
LKNQSKSFTNVIIGIQSSKKFNENLQFIINNDKNIKIKIRLLVGVQKLSLILKVKPDFKNQQIKFVSLLKIMLIQ